MDLGHAFLSPSHDHFFGTDAYGIDVLNRMISGAGTSLAVAASVTALTVGIGLLIGTSTAIAPGKAALVCRRFIDAVLAFPGLLLAILLASILPPSLTTVIFVLALTGWAGQARLYDALVRGSLSSPHIEALKATGASTTHAITKHVWPELLPQILVQALLTAAGAILGEASLSFLGIGGPVDSPSWGRLIAEGRQYLVEAPHLSIFPGLALAATLYAIHVAAGKLQKRPGLR